MKIITLFTMVFFCLLHAPVVSAQNLLLVKEINTQPNGSSFPNNFTVCGGKLYFFATDDANTKSIWVTLGTDATTQSIGPSGGVANSLSNLATFNGKLFFSYNNNVNGQELWTSDGTSGGTTLLVDINPGIGNSFPAAFTVCNNKLFFVAINNSGLSQLYVSDGTAGGTVNLRKASLLGGQTKLAILNNEVYFLSDDGTGSGNGLWKSDGTPGGTVLVKADIVPTTGIPGYSAVLGGNLYFNASDAATGSELWVTDGTGSGTHIVKNLRADAGAVTASGNPQNLLVYNSKLYFAASDDTHGMELFVSDGTDPGTQMVKDILPGSGGSQPYQATVYNGLLYFACWATNELWKTDGTDPGTVLVKNVLFTAPKFAASWNNKMYLIFGGSFYNVWESDGTTAGTKEIQPQNTSFQVTSYTDFGSDPNFTPYGTDLYFNGRCFSTANGFEPVKLTPAGPLAVTWLGVQATWLTLATAKISWQVTAEQQVKNYIIQQSIDGIHFSDVLTIAATNSTGYSCVAPASANSKNYFRVIEQDLNGSRTFSSVVQLQRNHGITLSVYPNPAADKLYVSGIAAFNTLKITDVKGRIVLRQNILPGFSSLDIKRLPAGMYLLTATGDKETQTLQFIKF